MRRVLKAGIRFYQKRISAHFPAVCRYRPSCSHYMLGAIDRFGSVRGVWLGTLRILRCNPFSKGGWDPVPLVFHPLGRHRIAQRDPRLSPAVIAEKHGVRLAARTKYHGSGR